MLLSVLRLNLLPPNLRLPYLLLMTLSKLDGIVDEIYVAKTFDTTTQLLPRPKFVPWRAISHALAFPTHVLSIFSKTTVVHLYSNAKVADFSLLETSKTSIESDHKALEDEIGMSKIHFLGDEKIN